MNMLAKLHICRRQFTLTATAMFYIRDGGMNTPASFTLNSLIIGKFQLNNRPRSWAWGLFERRKMETKHILSQIQNNFRTFGGGKATEGNLMAYALKDRPLQFAAGVDVQEVVDFVLEKAAASDLLAMLKQILPDYIKCAAEEGGELAPVRNKLVKQIKAVIALAEPAEKGE